MCTIGWIKTESGFIMFKNRDRRPNKKLLTNYIKKEQGILTFEDKKFNGCWFGINQYFGIAVAWGPYRKVPKGYTCENENFGINKKVLEEAKSVDEATKLYKKLFLRQKIGKSYIVIICDSKYANVLELVLNIVKIKKVTANALRSNVFMELEKFNNNTKIVERSRARLKKLRKLMQNVKKADDLKHVLKYHSRDNMENICRHDYSSTIGSAILEKRKDKIKIYHLLNKSPCKDNYKRETINIKEVM
jgi:hypothetical protein